MFGAATNGLREGQINLPAAVGELSERHPEMRPLRAWELQWTLFALGYVDDLICEDEIAAAMAGNGDKGRGVEMGEMVRTMVRTSEATTVELSLGSGVNGVNSVKDGGNG